ncbi:hypothetical protein Aab01nite_79650 [Paractinoplanes abujensis]|uniref:Uncharacterized protein n=1 Tax=Paractinoplanes abujensis TaxID=882441 RepID=A0A7W7G1Z7_9ACTN|nr:hypothetical protein [Actinoplanes abujensis]MBB4693174.1 hypothetical protein [Actinoplanes abujensis]GID24375.1 hypothetical protein Aab01nite_79650 [Actinoplanes abujensis]
MTVFRSLRALLAVVAVAAGAALLPASARAAAPQLTVVVADLQAGPASPLTPWTYLGLSPSSDWQGLLYDARLELDASGLGGVATVFVPSVGADGVIRPDTQQCRLRGAVTVCAIGDRAPGSWFPLPYIVVQSVPGAPAGRSGPLRISVSGRTETGAAAGPFVATPTVTVVP